MQPNKKSKKSGVKGSVAILKQSTQLVCVSQDSYPRKSILRSSHFGNTIGLCVSRLPPRKSMFILREEWK